MFSQIFRRAKKDKDKRKPQEVPPVFTEEESYIANRIEIFAREFGLKILPAADLFANAESLTPLRYTITAYRVRPESTSFRYAENGTLSVHTSGFDLKMRATEMSSQQFLGLTLDPNERTYAGPRQIASLLSRGGFIFNLKGRSFQNGDFGHSVEGRRSRQRPFTFETSTHDLWRARFLGSEPSSEWTVDLNKAAASAELQSKLPESFSVVFSTSFVPQSR